MASTEKRLTDRVDKISDSMNEIKGKTELFGDIGIKLRDILAAERKRGKFGEILIENILHDVLPKSCWDRQYSLSSGQVDIIIKTKHFIIPIDCKFPLNNYEKMLTAQDQKTIISFKKQFFKDVQKRIDETSKYVLPEEGTTNYSLMYVPAESIFLTILEDYDTIRYSMDKLVLICSPITFYYIMHAINETIKREQLPEKIEELYNEFLVLRKEIIDYGNSFNTLGTHLRNAYNKYNEATSQVDKIKGHSDTLILKEGID
jgi:DNA recombination protein RmuC